MRQQYGCNHRRLAVLSRHRQISATGAVRVIKYVQNKLALKLHQLDRLTNLSAFWDQAVMLNESAYLFATCHDDIIFRSVIIDRNGAMFFP